MTRKDFDLIAKAIKGSVLVGQRDNSQLKRTAEGVAYALMSTNERFDHERFLTACGF